MSSRSLAAGLSLCVVILLAGGKSLAYEKDTEINYTVLTLSGATTALGQQEMQSDVSAFV